MMIDEIKAVLLRTIVDPPEIYGDTAAYSEATEALLDHGMGTLPWEMRGLPIQERAQYHLDNVIAYEKQIQDGIDEFRASQTNLDLCVDGSTD